MKEQIDIEHFIELLKEFDKDFETESKNSSDKNAIALYVCDKFSKYCDWAKSESFPFKLIHLTTVPGRRQDEETRTVILERKADNKLFSLELYDAGLIGPGTLILRPYLEEVVAQEITTTIYV